MLIDKIRITIYFLLSYFFILLNFFVKIRFQELETRNIGHFSKSIEVYLSEVELGIQKKYRLDFWIRNKKVANKYLLKQLKKHLNIIHPRIMLGFLYYLKKKKFNKLIIPYKHPSSYIEKEWHFVDSKLFKNLDQWHFYDNRKVLIKTKPKIILPEKDKKFFNNILIKELKTTSLKKIVLFYGRDPIYRKLQHNIRNIDTMNYRNTDVNTYKISIENISKKGYISIRMGRNVEKKLLPNTKNFFDYSNSEIASDELDLYLSSICEFGIFDSGGFNSLPCLFRKPLALVNIAHLREIKNRSDGTTPLIIFKKIFSTKLNRILNFSEYESFRVYQNILDSDFEKNNLKLIDNTPEEILDLTLEAEKKFNLKEYYDISKEEKEIQIEAKKILGKLNYGDLTKIDIGHKFLLKNINLIK